jgi:sugar/nucleoside kinase (ribokinase family)
MRSAAIVTLGELLVEIMRPEPDIPLYRSGPFVGPLASGAPAIFAHAAGRLGARARLVGTCGPDAFGDLILAKLSSAGVDVTSVRRVEGQTTGAAFVAYRSDGERDFVFHARHSAAAALGPGDLGPATLADAGWLHVTGTTLPLGASVRDACYRAVRLAAERGDVTISFDPNLRPELISPEAARALCAPVLEYAHVILPSASEACLLTGTADVDEACRRLLAGRPHAVILKRGADGCTVIQASGSVIVPSLVVDEVDPTGAGDTFSAAFAVARLRGDTILTSARFAAVAAALSVTGFGPMEGAPSLADVEQALARIGS